MNAVSEDKEQHLEFKAFGGDGMDVPWQGLLDATECGFDALTDASDPLGEGDS